MFRINVRNWQGYDSALQISNGEVVLQSTGKIEDSFSKESEAKETLASIPIADTYELSIEEVANVETN